MPLGGENYPPFMIEGKWGSQRLEPNLVFGRSQWLHRPWDTLAGWKDRKASWKEAAGG